MTAVAGVASGARRRQTICLHGQDKNYYAWLPIVDVTVASGDNFTARAVAVIDSGSTCSFVAESTLQRLQMQIPKGQHWQIGVVGGGTVNNSFGEVQLGLEIPYTSRQVVRKFRVLKNITGTLNRLTLTGAVGSKTWQYHSKATKIDLLIGIDSLFEIFLTARAMPLKRIYEVRTVFGKTYAGSIADKHRHIENTLVALKASAKRDDDGMPIAQQSDDELCQALRKFWDWEHIGIKETPDDEKPAAFLAVEEAMQQAYFQEGHYHVPLLFRENHAPLWNNVYVAMKRFESTERKYMKKPEVAKALKAAINTWIEKGFASYVPQQQIPQQLCYYGPISAVVKELAYKSKVRPIADYSCGAPLKDHAKKLAKGEKLYPSLNSTLLECTVQYPSTAGMLMRQRLIRYSISADLTAFFMNVKLFEKHRKYHRFLFRPDENGPIRHLHMNVVSFGSGDSPTKATWVFNEQTKLWENVPGMAEAAKSLRRNVYVDDYLGGAQNRSSAVKLAKDICTIGDDANFRFNHFLSNDPEVLNSIPKERRAKSAVRIIASSAEDDALDEGNAHKALGVIWQLEDDTIAYSGYANLKLPEGMLTKRKLSSHSAKIYDPVGHLAAFVLRSKLTMKKCWESKTDWDRKVTQEVSDEFYKWAQDVKNLDKIKLKRCILHVGKAVEAIQLHMTCDACFTAVGCNGYIRVVYKDGTIDCDLLMARSQLAPSKSPCLTIPRMELASLLLAAKLAEFMCNELDMNINDVTYHSDSLTAIYYAKSPPTRWAQWVANRVRRIQKIVSDTTKIRHVAGEINPSDMVSRGCSVEELTHTDLWFKGPHYFRQPVENWPPEVPEVDPGDSEACKQLRPDVALSMHPQEPHFVDVMHTRTNDLTKLVKTLAFAVRGLRAFLLRCKQKYRKPLPPLLRQSHKGEQPRMVEPDEADVMNTVLLKHHQAWNFAKEIEDLKRSTSKHKSVHQNSRVRNLDPFLDDEGVLRIGGRMHKMKGPMEILHPILLDAAKPKKLQAGDYVSKLIMQQHIRNYHAGPSHTVAALRTKGYWIIRARRSCESVFKTCVTCQKENKRRYMQKMAPLEVNRVTTHMRPFTAVHADSVGPILCYIDPKPAKGIPDDRRSWKCHVYAFVCSSTRCTHLELAMSLNAHDFFMALSRFTARRGCPSEITTDRHATYIHADKELQVLEQNHWPTNLHVRKAAEFGIRWRFADAYSHSQMGSIERRNACFKSTIHKVAGKQMLTYWQLETLVTMAESVINSTPLVAATANPEDTEALTPNHLTMGYPLTGLPLAKTDKESMAKLGTPSVRDAMLRWEHRQSLDEQFANAYAKEYLLSLQQRSKAFKIRDNLQVGDLCLIVNENLPRYKWNLGRVVETFASADSLVRSVVVLTKGKRVTRGVDQLIQLELPADDAISEIQHARNVSKKQEMLDETRADFRYIRRAETDGSSVGSEQSDGEEPPRPDLKPRSPLCHGQRQGKDGEADQATSVQSDRELQLGRVRHDSGPRISRVRRSGDGGGGREAQSGRRPARVRHRPKAEGDGDCGQGVLSNETESTPSGPPGATRWLPGASSSTDTADDSSSDIQGHGRQRADPCGVQKDLGHSDGTHRRGRGPDREPPGADKSHATSQREASPGDGAVADRSQSVQEGKLPHGGSDQDHDPATVRREPTSHPAEGDADAYPAQSKAPKSRYGSRSTPENEAGGAPLLPSDQIAGSAPRGRTAGGKSEASTGARPKKSQRKKDRSRREGEPSSALRKEPRGAAGTGGAGNVQLEQSASRLEAAKLGLPPVPPPAAPLLKMQPVPRPDRAERARRRAERAGHAAAGTAKAARAAGARRGQVDVASDVAADVAADVPVGVAGERASDAADGDDAAFEQPLQSAKS